MRRGVALLLVALVFVGFVAWMWHGSSGNGAKFEKTRPQPGGPGGGSSTLILDAGGVHLADPYNNVPLDLSGHVPANDSIARWWDSLPAVEAEEIQGYINSLWRIASGQGNYTQVFDSQYWQAPAKPQNGTVKVASWRLWCGARLDMIAYIDPNSDNVNVVIYGTIENMTEYRYCMGLALTVGDGHGFLPGFAWGLEHGVTTQELIYLSYLTDGQAVFKIKPATYLWRIRLPGMGDVVYDSEKVTYHLNFTAKDDGSVWGEVYRDGKLIKEIQYPNLDYFKNETGLDHPQNTTITAYNKTHGINVYILLEEPVLSIYVPLKTERFHPYYYAYLGAEAMWWTLVGYPAFSLAANLRWHGVNITQEYTNIAEWAAETARQVVLYQVGHPGDKPTDWVFVGPSVPPSTLRYEGWGVCADQSSATQIFVSTALGLPTVYWFSDTFSHAISYLLVPSKIIKSGEGFDKLHGDYDGDGKPDYAVVIVDTAELTPIERYNYTTIEQAYPPLIFILYKNGEYLDNNLGFNLPLLGYVESLPAPIKAPWQELVYNITGIRYVANGIPPYNYHAEVNLTKYINIINDRLWLDKDYIGLPNGQQLPLDIYNKTPQEILQEMNDKILRAAEAWKDVYGYNLSTTTLAIASSTIMPEWGDYDSIHVPLTVAAEVYALALQNYNWNINPPNPPTQPQQVPGSIQQALTTQPQQLNQWNK